MSSRSRAHPWWGTRKTLTTTRPLPPPSVQPTRAEFLALIEGFQRRSREPKFIYFHTMLPDEWAYFFDMRIPIHLAAALDAAREKGAQRAGAIAARGPMLAPEEEGK